MTPVLTGRYAIPLVVVMIGLSTHVTLLRASTGISIMDGGNTQLAERIRRHGNFVENVPIIVLLMAIAELLGSTAVGMHTAGALLLVGRALHAAGVYHGNPKALPRILGGGSATTLATLVATTVIAVRALAV